MGGAGGRKAVPKVGSAAARLLSKLKARELECSEALLKVVAELEGNSTKADDKKRRGCRCLYFNSRCKEHKATHEPCIECR